MNSVLHFFITTTGPKPVSFYDSNFHSLEHTIRLSGYPHNVVSEILSSICHLAGQKNLSIEVIHHCLDNSIQGVLLPGISTGIYGFDVYDENEPHILAALGSKHISSVRSHIQAAREVFSNARAIHNQQEDFYIQNMDFSVADRVTQNTIDLLFQQETKKQPGNEIHRFFGAATANGNLNYLPSIFKDTPRRCFLKGRPGTGKSTFLKKIALDARQRGYQVEIYHCSLDPNSLDAVIIRECGICLFDSTAPHEYFPTDPQDQIIDLYSSCVKPGTDEKYETELQKLNTAYKETVSQASEHLKRAKKEYDDFYLELPQIDPIEVSRITENILSQI